MTRRLFVAALAFASLAAALLVARLPANLDERVVTRRHHNSDPLLTAALLQLNTTSLLHHPTRYFRPPILFPDPNPYRSTEPFLSEALLALPLRLGFGERPARVYSVLVVATLALVAFFTGLLLHTLGVRPGIALAAACLSVTIASTTVFLDRLQSLSIQWLPLGLLLAARYLRRGGRGWLAAFGACAFLTAQASLYTSVMLVAAALFMAPLAFAARGVPEVRARAAPIAGAIAAAGLVSLAVLWPYLRGRQDVLAYASAAYAAHKPWGQAFLAELAVSPPEYGKLGWPLEPWASWDGVYPGAAFVALCASIFAAALLARPSADPSLEPSAGGTAFAASKPATAALLLGFAAATAGSAWSGGGAVARIAADVLLWAALLAWCVRLALWPLGAPGEATRALASAAWLAALVLLLLSLGSPIRLSVEHPPLVHGLFAPLSAALVPLRELRELKRFLLPAGWAAVVAAALSLELRLRRLPQLPRLGPALAALVVGLALIERARADTRSAAAPGPPAYYDLLQRCETRGGLLELPFDPWGRISSVRRMLWQPRHGRPIVAGKVSLDPAWYTPAGEVFESFPSRESVLLLQAWGITSVLDARPDAWREPPPAALPEGLLLRAEAPRREGAVRLFETAGPGAAVSALCEPGAGPGRWVSPAAGAVAEAQRAAADGSLETAAAVEPAERPVFVVPEGARATAVLLDYGAGRLNRVPRRLSVEVLTAGNWRDVTREPTGDLLRARAADQLMKQRSARLVIALREPASGALRLVAEEGVWDLPELRLRVADAPR